VKETESAGTRQARRVVDERYELIEPIGTGGMAEVWRALDHRLRRDVALKLLSGPSARDDSRRKRLEREARALACMSHPNIVAVYDYGEAAEPGGGVLPYVVMELVEGPDLQRYLEQHGPLPIDEARRLLGGVLTAVERAHAAGIVHGDLKPANVLLDDGVPKVSDFGVARILSEETGTTTLAATPTFAAPEVLRGVRPTRASDVYSAACLAFQMLTGRPPYEGSNSWEIAAKHMEDPVPHATRLRGDVPIPFDEAVRHGMEKDPHRRFASAARFKEAVGAPLRTTVPMRAAAGSVVPREPTEVIVPGPDLRAAAFFGPLAGWAERAPHRRRVLGSALRRSRPLHFALAALAFAGMLALLLSFRPQTVRVPDVTGRSAAAGATLLRRAGLEVQGVSYSPIAMGDSGRVLRTVPAARSVVKPGAQVHIIATALAAPAPTVAPVAEERTDRRGRGRGKEKDERD
jgi:serine/threonine-protein kinase